MIRALDNNATVKYSKNHARSSNLLYHNKLKLWIHAPGTQSTVKQLLH